MPAHPRSLRPPAPHRRERQRRGRPAARLSARAAASLWRRRARRPSCQKRRRQCPRRTGLAWLFRVPRLGDSNLYLRRNGDDLMLTVEHRAAPSLAPIAIALTQRGPALALEAVDPPEPPAPGKSPLDERIAAALADIAGAMPFAELRTRCRVRAATLYERLAVLTAAGRIAKTDESYRLADS